MHQCPCEHETLGHTPRIAHHLLFPAITKTEFLEQRICARIAFCAGYAMVTRVKRKYFTRSQAAIKVALLGDDRDTLLDTHWVSYNIDAHNMRRATRWYNICSQHTNSRRLTRSIWSEQAKDLAFLYGKRDVVNGIERCLGIALHQVLNFN